MRRNRIRRADGMVKKMEFLVQLITIHTHTHTHTMKKTGASRRRRRHRRVISFYIIYLYIKYIS